MNNKLKTLFEEWREAEKTLLKAGHKIDKETAPLIHVIRTTRDVGQMRDLITAMPDTGRVALLIDILQNELGCWHRLDEECDCGA